MTAKIKGQGGVLLTLLGNGALRAFVLMLGLGAAHAEIADAIPAPSYLGTLAILLGASVVRTTVVGK